MFKFTINHKDNNSDARTAIIETSHGKIKTPAFIPVATKATIKTLTPNQINEIGFDAILSNTYHLYLRPGPELIEKMGKLAKFMSWNKPTFTDSGGFQVFSLNDGLCQVSDDKAEFRSFIDNSKHIFTPERSIQIQRQIGADIIFAFDQCIHFDEGHEKCKAAMIRTHAWEKRSLEEFQKDPGYQALYGIVQGGHFLDLREESAKFVASLPFQGFGIGSIFGEPKQESIDVVKHTMKFLPYDKPKHMLGIGSVDDIFNFVELGADTFDCVLPTRLARSGYVFITPEDGGNLENKFRFRINNVIHREDSEPLDKTCNCYVCKNFTKAYIHHLFRANELLAYTLVTYHNLAFFYKLMEKIREAIENNNLTGLKEKWFVHGQARIKNNGDGSKGRKNVGLKEKIKETTLQ